MTCETDIGTDSSIGFSSKLGYVFSAAGSAVGLGNIWRFPYLTAKYGGGIFLLTYLILMFTFGYTLLVSENTLGRMTGKGPVGSYRHFCAGRRPFLKFIGVGGWLNAIVPLLILPYYCVIGGWVVKYVVAMAVNPISRFSVANPEASGEYFTSFICNPTQSALCFLAFTAIVFIVNMFGVKSGIERVNKVLMPSLVIMCIGICIYCMTLPNAKEGIAYFLKPDLTKFSSMTMLSAIGQLFYSLSIGMGIMFTYGSYMRKDDNLISNVNQVQVFDFGVSFLAGLMIIPAVVAFGGPEAAKKAGPGLIFCVLPQVFANFAGGRIVGIVFFVLVFVAAVTSAISLLETNVQSIGQECKICRKKAVSLAAVETVALGGVTILGYNVLKGVHPLNFIKVCRGYGILDSLDFLSNNLLMPVAAMFTTLLVIAVVGLDEVCDAATGKYRWPRRFIFKLCARLIVIPFLFVVLFSALLGMG